MYSCQSINIISPHALLPTTCPHQTSTLTHFHVLTLHHSHLHTILFLITVHSQSLFHFIHHKEYTQFSNSLFVYASLCSVSWLLCCCLALLPLFVDHLTFLPVFRLWLLLKDLELFTCFNKLPFPAHASGLSLTVAQRFYILCFCRNCQNVC